MLVLICLLLKISAVFSNSASITIRSYNYTNDRYSRLGYNRILDVNTTLDIFSKIINSETVPSTIEYLRVNEYYFTKNFIKTIENLPYLDALLMDDLNLTNIPQLRNLRSIYSIALRKNNIIFIKKETFSFLPVGTLYLGHNSIQVVEDGAFGNNLMVLKIQCNDISSVGNWFSAPEKLHQLVLTGNKIEVIDPDLFKEFTSLTTLELDHNLITRLDGSSPNRNRFHSINLAHNKVTELNDAWFPQNRFTADTFDISFNHITYIPKTLLQRMKVTSAFVIDGNPWQCTCYELLRKEIKWDNYGTFQFPKHRDGEPRCVKSLAFADKCIGGIDQESVDYFFNSTTPYEKTREVVCAEDRGRQRIITVEERRPQFGQVADRIQ